MRGAFSLRAFSCSLKRSSSPAGLSPVPGVGRGRGRRLGFDRGASARLRTADVEERLGAVAESINLWSQHRGGWVRRQCVAFNLEGPLTGKVMGEERYTHVLDRRTGVRGFSRMPPHLRLEDTAADDHGDEALHEGTSASAAALRYTFIHTYIHTHTHTYIHIYTHTHSYELHICSYKGM